MIDRDILDLLSKKAISGVALAGQMGISRSAVWKRIQHLRDDGFEIETRPGHGYFLKTPVEWLDREFICRRLNPEANKDKSAVRDAPHWFWAVWGQLPPSPAPALNAALVCD